MNNLENLVPPMELCKQIPAGAFADSALVWVKRKSEDGFTANGTGFNGATGKVVLATREHANSLKYNKGLIAEPVEFFPAPTLQEILIAIEDAGMYCPTCFHQANRWAVDCEDDKSADLYDAEDPDNPATAALNVWLKINGGAK